MMLKALPLVHFWSVFLLKEQMMTSVRKNIKNAGLISTTLGARDFSSAVSGFCQVFIVTRAKSFSRGFGLRPKMCRPSAKHRKFPPHARKTSGTQGRSAQNLAK